MRVLISGGSGFIGSALSEALRARGDSPLVLSRSGEGPLRWEPTAGLFDPGALDGVDAVVNLAGRRIFPPFTKTKKEQILESRRESTRLLAQAVAIARPAVFVSGSAVGYYGSRGDEVLTEASGPGEGFLAGVTQAWEAEAAPARDAGVRTVLLRTGLVLHPSGGLLPTLSLPVKLGVGGPIGGGGQWWPWVSLRDEVRAILHCLDGDLAGPVNVAAPGVLTNKDFTRVLARHLRRPAAVPIPAFAIRAVLGRDAADDLVLASQRVAPKALIDSGFGFEHPDLETTLVAF